MFLKSIEYTEFGGTSRLWKLEGCTLDNINLIVGKNATGKTRTLRVINGLANLLSGQGKLKYTSGNYAVKFDDNGKNIDYVLHYENRSIIKEELDIDSDNKFNRREDGIGKIYYDKETRKIEFQTPQNVLAVARRDAMQHPFLEDLHNWGRDTRRYLFGTELGQNLFAVEIKDEEKAKQQELDLKDTRLVVAKFLEGNKKYPEKFVEKILNDMNTIGFSLEEIRTSVPEGIVMKTNLLGKPIGLYVKESELSHGTEQREMSQGMFRALSLIIQVNYSVFSSTPSCILIDDIGEGLDFERSSALVKLLIERTKNSSLQLIMTTNDRFIMNSVPLEYWLIIQRIGGRCKIYNQRNSQQLFDDFELTGLNNFDFFSSEYYLKDNCEN